MPLTPEELDAFLGESRLCHFATVDANGRPRVRPLWYPWRDGAFWFTTRLEARHTGRDVGATATATISIATDDRPYRAVVATGRVEVVGKDEDLLRAIATRYGRREGEAWLSRAMNESDRTVLRMVPTTILSWDYGRGDSRRQNAGESMRTDR
ncbi:MAG TPA: pyridoxamine 5'-phosphate oxidase family protein [Actinomycetota bacterium]|nr:pyridoxamine 5'-phosphate oxidase family protein [Actinomycetota bacterium]